MSNGHKLFSEGCGIIEEADSHVRVKRVQFYIDEGTVHLEIEIKTQGEDFISGLVYLTPSEIIILASRLRNLAIQSFEQEHSA